MVWIIALGLLYYLTDIKVALKFMGSLVDFGFVGLFISALLAATILPLSSEVILSALLLSGLSPISLIAVATVGNVAGSLINYALGYWAGLGLAKKWLKMTENEFDQAEQRFKKYGVLSLCFSWVPIIGDPLTVVAGILRVRLLWFLILVGLGKLLRYIVLSYMVLKVV
ncbi:YqaA family protein [Microbulbifer variabilis]|uniref:YqaA family protein n=1 Tax=Microbulbifer variabilis TaxID=266805 RepID=UPI000370D8B3|nr:YqaA family protein [Microbulbifer variabilis]